MQSIYITIKLRSEYQQLVEDTLAAIASFPFAISRVRFSPDARISLIALKCYKNTLKYFKNDFLNV